MTGTDLEVRRPQQVVLSNDQLQYIAHTEFVKKGIRGNLPAILATVAYGRALGLPDMIALSHVVMIDGDPSLEAVAMNALVRQRGHSIQKVDDTPEGTCTVRGKRGDSGDEITVTWTLAMAERAGLLGKQNWRKYPEAMLWARAVSQLCRELFADVFAGATYTPEELEGSLSERPGTQAASPAQGESVGGMAPGAVKPQPRPDRSESDQVSGVDPMADGTPPTAANDDPPAAGAVTQASPPEPASTPEDRSLSERGSEQVAAGARSDALAVGETPAASRSESDPAAGTPFDYQVGPLDATAVAPTAGTATDGKPATEPQKKKLNTLLGIHTKGLDDEQAQHLRRRLYATVALKRVRTTDALMLELGAVDADGQVHWSPLRDSLTRGEAHDLIDRLEKLEGS
jgi:hypothetical protein